MIQLSQFEVIMVNMAFYFFSLFSLLFSAIIKAGLRETVRGYYKTQQATQNVGQFER